MRHLLAECGFPLDEIRTGSWGNEACARTFLRSMVPYCPWRHSLKNEPDFPIVVWALATRA